MRFRVEPRDVPPEMGARRIGLSLVEYREKRTDLEARGFPKPDPTTGNLDLDAIDQWRRRRHPELFAVLPVAVDARSVTASRLARMRGD